jgi:hypothetical protein
MPLISISSKFGLSFKRMLRFITLFSLEIAEIPVIEIRIEKDGIPAILQWVKPFDLMRNDIS